MPRSTREVLLRLLLLLAGLAVAHLGVTLFLLADLGSDPFNVLVQGGARSLRDMTGSDALTHGRVHIAANVAIIAVLLSIDRPRVKLGTFVCMAAGGPKSDSAEPRQRPPPAKNCRKRDDCRLTRAALTRDLGRKFRHARFAAAATEWGFV